MEEGAPKFKIIGLGELVWDLFPDGPRLGGAPANFAYHATVLGDHGIVASRVGADLLGEKALKLLRESDLDVSAIQIDRQLPTGTVRVDLDGSSEPRYRIVSNVAWDAMEWTPEWQEIASRADAISFTALAQRSPQSRQTVLTFIGSAKDSAVRVFDPTLRESFFDAEIITESLRLAQVVKLNDVELKIILGLLNLKESDEETNARQLLSLFDLDLICVTRGARGSLLLNLTESVEHNGISIELGDPVGAGDSFTAALIHHYLRGSSLSRMSEAANQLGAWVASQRGATPVIPARLLASII